MVEVLPPPTHIGVYLYGRGEGYFKFGFHAADKNTLNKTPKFQYRPQSPYSKVKPTDNVLIATVKIPLWMREDIRQHAEGQKPKQIGTETSLGYIDYEILPGVAAGHGTTARPVQYYPKSMMEWEREGQRKPSERFAQGLGYLLEHACTKYLKGNEIKQVMAYGRHLLQPRINQLKKIGLPIDRAVPIDEWINGLLRGVKHHAEKYAAEKRVKKTAR